MSEFFEVLRSAIESPEGLESAHKRVASWGTAKLKPLLVAHGFRVEDVPNDPAIAARLLLASRHIHRATERSSAPKELDGLIEGVVYASDAPELQYRYSVVRGDSVEVWALHAPIGKEVKLVKEYNFGAADVGDESFQKLQRREEEMREADDPKLAPPEDPHMASTTVAAQHHYKVDVKLVHWIPFRPNDIPIPARFLPEQWRNASMPQEIDFALRLALATGNPTPPDSFTRQSWASFLESKEYRAVFWATLYLCCPGGNPKSFVVRHHRSGYTPAPSDIESDPSDTLRERLTKFHSERQNPGSMVEGMMSGSGVGGQGADTFTTYFLPPFLGPMAQVGTPDQIDDAIQKLRELNEGTNPVPHSYSQGDERFQHRETNSQTCLRGTLGHWFRIGKTHNLLNYMLTGSLVPFQGGWIDYELCCDGYLRLIHRYTPFPSVRLYLNNAATWEYDMLSAPFEKIRRCLNVPNIEQGIDTLDQFVYSNPENVQMTTKQLLEQEGCRTPPENEWIIDAI